ncbi:type II toxin-antitoxin system Phd/YefM family antitoxin [Specibacter cremeus]|uniref:type II toxin-antitoxin system Phd/YefM family antitoxin n=1 Tax=Specibacter cremeus TaxID=1629051 RepID=UPI000F7A1CFB|nr:type II toxin-antitoxin system Phd/YefM family antitoxin [Specibacter cremeus]
MTDMTLTEARAHLAKAVDTARMEHDPVWLTKHGKRLAAVIDAEDLARLLAAAEDLEDLHAAEAAREERAAGAAPIPWDEVKADLGLL